MSAFPFSLRQLHYFVTVVDMGSFVRAAETLNISQPPLTQALQSMEAALGCCLLDRRKRPIAPTAEGQQLYQKASRIVQAAEQAATELKDMAQGKAGQLRIGLTDDYLSSPLLKRLLIQLDQLEAIDVTFDVGFTDALLEALQSDKLDCVLGNEPVYDLGDAVRAVSLPPSKIIAIVHQDDFDPIPKRLKLDQLAGQPIILLDERSTTPFARQTRALIDAMETAPAIFRRANHAALSTKLTSMGWGIALISEYSLLSLPQNCVAIPIDHPIAHLRHSLFVATGKTPLIIEAILESLRVEDG